MSEPDAALIARLRAEVQIHRETANRLFGCGGSEREMAAVFAGRDARLRAIGAPVPEEPDDD